MNKFTALSCCIALISLSVLPNLAQAQKLYRCGNVYQDKPCEKSEPTKVLSGSAGPASADNRKVDLTCSQRGAASQKISWAREVGKTASDQLESSSGADRELIEDVYRRRGNSSEVRTAIEDDCMAEKTKADRLAAMMEASGAGKGAKTTTNDAKPAAPSQTETKPPAPVIDTAVADKKKLCDSLAARLKANQDKQRTGGSAAVMESLNEQRRDIEVLKKAGGC